MAGGRPTIFTQELGDFICQELAAGKSLTKICKPDAMPSPSSVYGWLRINKEFLDNYTRARADKADYHFEELLDLSDDVNEDALCLTKAKLQIDTRKWAISRMDTKKYGDSAQLRHANHDGTGDVNIQTILAGIPNDSRGNGEADED